MCLSKGETVKQSIWIIYFLILASALAAGPKLSGDQIKKLASDVDENVRTLLAEKNLKPAEKINDEVFLRRAYLDILGRIPSLSEAQKFFGNKSEEKRSELINSL